MMYSARITVFGEYLMHNKAWGLILKGNLYITHSENHKYPLHPYYNYKKDSVRTELLKKGYEVENSVRGNLPFGWGFASSSALSLIHLYKNALSTELNEIVDEIDHQIHGFIPSGLDSTFHIRGNGGLYLKNCWRDINIPENNIKGYCILPKKEKKMTLFEVQQQIHTRGKKLCSLANEMTTDLITNNSISYENLYDYANELLTLNIYSKGASSIIADALDVGIIAKCIGGLYDKAILLYKINDKKSKELENYISKIEKHRSCEYLGLIV